MTNQLLQTLQVMVEKEKTAQSFRARARIKGRITKKNITKNGNITLTIKRGEREISFLVLKNHKDKILIAQKLLVGNPVSAEGIRKRHFIICTKLKMLEKFDESKQMTLDENNNA